MFWFKAFFGYILYFVFINPISLSGTNVTSKIFEILFEMPSDSRNKFKNFTNISNVSPRVKQNESKKLCIFQRTFEIENISTNENISVNENIVIMLLKKSTL